MPATIEEYRRFTHFLGAVLGRDYEIVLHWRDKEGSFFIAEIEHSYISGRNINSPITDFALKLVRQRVYLEKDFISGYRATSMDGSSIQGSTYFIRDEPGTALLGMLCINFDPSRYVRVADDLLDLVGLRGASGEVVAHRQSTDGEPQPSESNAIEILRSSIQDSIRSVIDTYLLKPGVTLTQDSRIKIVRALYDQGIFQIKGALPIAARLLGVSDQTVYRYLRMIDR